MVTKTQSTTTDIIKQGWQSLVTELGQDNAVRFIRFFPRDSKDSVSYWKNFWQDKTVDEIHGEVKQARENGKI